ncbi:fibrobacter succinogenes major paralogous domain-containing protein [Litoribaculum gwangyangense]|uniref:Fibrobacter succinogenes major paralogous domain-containing protein n=1 Tax=Litoribaculum gwangyangense TaxID=1130722 RepID=A0ABP9CLI5_9FLAO
MKSFIRLNIILLLLFSLACSKDDNLPNSELELTVTDADGNIYNTIKMGNQIWMLENLKTTKYNDGSPITLYTFEEHGINWGSLNNQEAFYQWASTEDLNNVVDQELPFDYYGAMYNHFAIESGKLAPEGWRIPTEADFRELERFLASEGHEGNEATVLKTETGWLPGFGGGTNLYGFNGLPNGYVSAVGTPTFGQGVCTWATSDLIGDNLPSQRRILVQLFDQNTILFDDAAIQIGAGIRCIKE